MFSCTERIKDYCIVLYCIVLYCIVLLSICALYGDALSLLLSDYGFYISSNGRSQEISECLQLEMEAVL